MDIESSHTSRRIKRAQQLRRQRAKATSGRRVPIDFDDNGNDKTFVVSGICTLIGALFIVGIGVGLARLFFLIFPPACVTNHNELTAVFSRVSLSTTTTNGVNYGASLLSSSNNSHDVTIEGKRKKDNNNSVVADAAKSPFFPFLATAKFPPQCTNEQYDVLKKQLPGSGCEEFQQKAWLTQSCSFASKTICGNANPHWFYDYIQQQKNVTEDNDDEDITFRAIIVGCNKGYEAIELLRIASPPSSDTNRYSWIDWKSEFHKVDGSDKIDESLDCPIVGTVPSNKNSLFKKQQVFCIEGYSKTFDQLKKTKDALGFGDELDLTHMIAASNLEVESQILKVYTKDRIGESHVGISYWSKRCRKHPEDCTDTDTNSIDNWIKTKPSLMIDKPPIHYMSITAEGSDYDILRGTAQNLARIQYLDFGYHWNYRWNDKSLKDLIFRLKKKGFVCYWTGSDGERMWRISDCWQEHYELKFVASIGCVNSNIPAAEPLLNQMERIFLDTLNKN